MSIEGSMVVIVDAGADVVPYSEAEAEIGEAVVVGTVVSGAVVAVVVVVEVRSTTVVGTLSRSASSLVSTAIVFDCPTVADVVGVVIVEFAVLVFTFVASGNTNAIANDDGVGFTSLLRS